MKTIEIENYILSEVEKGNIGVATMQLYEQGFSVKSINKTIKNMLDNNRITISSPVGAGRLKKSDEYGVRQALKTHSFDIRESGKNYY